ncbi:DUF3293 domain-containing protein [Haloferula rosea]|uniref:DUF3293 domain-containing protein n=1 Tax=Haloferula rosea TaxID=490093 RepID=A0A934VDG0_9BACT|nr:DUF3293 domain-containing protein [Haloferula rosea]
MSSTFPACYYDTRFRIEGAPTPWPDTCAIITAWNPMDRCWSRKMNVAADHRLRRLLERQHLKHFRASGQSPDGSHQEPGWAIVTNLGNALKIGKRYKQRAIWWVVDDELQLHSCLTGHQETVAGFAQRMV